MHILFFVASRAGGLYLVHLLPFSRTRKTCRRSNNRRTRRDDLASSSFKPPTAGVMKGETNDTAASFYWGGGHDDRTGAISRQEKPGRMRAQDGRWGPVCGLYICTRDPGGAVDIVSPLLRASFDI
ncbi:hypothetical protein LX36DRAFT_473221 [Colletotrichum falcatum]|nr:hypothetical protein LX36DRAFT_473221 [Colletotrichum falcatum]